MMNKLLDNCFQTELNTIVLDRYEDNGRYWYMFEETVFYVEGGGMASDIGVINDNIVLEMKIIDGKQWHLLDEKLEVGTHALMSVNLHERFRKCQIHTAQHLISALLGNIYKVKTLSHHVRDDENEIEFDLPTFTDKMAFELMVLCNGLIRDDLEVSVVYPTKLEASQYVSIQNVKHEDLRVIKIGNLDYNLCGCMHVPSLRYIQMIYITGFEKTPRGYKIKYSCGDQLLNSVSKRYEVLNEASRTLALSHLYINTGIYKQINEQKSLTKNIVFWKQKYFEQVARAAHVGNIDVIHYEFDDIDIKSAVQLVQYTITEYKKPVLLLTKVLEKCHLIIASPKDVNFDCRTTFKQISEIFCLKGGGSTSLAQGGGQYSKQLSEYIKGIQKI